MEPHKRCIQITGLITAVRTLTIIPVPGKESVILSSSLPWFPVIGLVLGSVLYVIGVIWLKLFAFDWFAGGAVILLAAETILTRGLHLDGLADWADAMGGKADRETRLSIMKDSHVGAFGMIVLAIVLLMKWTALERLLSTGSWIWVIFILLISRDMMVELIATLPYARSEGMAHPFSMGVTSGHRRWAHSFSIVFCLLGGPLGLALLVLGWALSIILRIFFKKYFGGITGDLLGMANEMIEVTLLMICALSGGLMNRSMGWHWFMG